MVIRNRLNVRIILPTLLVLAALGLAWALIGSTAQGAAVQPLLEFVEVHTDGVGGVDGLIGAAWVEVSPDGNQVYVTGYDDNSVAVFSRDSTTGTLTFLEAHFDGVGGVDGLAASEHVEVSPDGKHVYISGPDDNAVALFNRDLTTGALTFVEFFTDGVDGVDGLRQVHHAKVSPDGKHVYTAGGSPPPSPFDPNGAVAVFSRDSTTGALTFVEVHTGGLLAGLPDYLESAYYISVSPDGNHVYVAGAGDDAVAVYSRDSITGALTFVEVQRDGVGGVDGLKTSSL